MKPMPTPRLIRCPETGVRVQVDAFQKVLNGDTAWHWMCPYCVGTYHPVPDYTQFGVDLDAPDLSSFSIEELARSLAKIPRFGGHIDFMYTVADHQLVLAELLRLFGGTLDDQLGALLHDAHESPLGGDLPRPLKLLLGDSYRRIEERMDKAVSTRWPFTMTPLVHFWDDQILYVERTILGAGLNPAFQFQSALTSEQWENACDQVQRHLDLPWRTVARSYVERYNHLQRMKEV